MIGWPRRFEFVPLWGIKVFLLHAPRRVECPWRGRGSSAGFAATGQIELDSCGVSGGMMSNCAMKRDMTYAAPSLYPCACKPDICY